jgi:hypothetical protein
VTHRRAFRAVGWAKRSVPPISAEYSALQKIASPLNHANALGGDIAKL